MKKVILTLGVAIILALGSCSGEKNHSHEESHDKQAVEEVSDQADDEASQLNENEEQAIAAVYQYPMKCEGEKTYDKEGKCPKCGMALEVVKEDQSDQGHSHDDGSHEH